MIQEEPKEEYTVSQLLEELLEKHEAVMEKLAEIEEKLSALNVDFGRGYETD